VSEVEVRELGPEETGLGFEAMRPLRTQLKGREEFVERVNGRQRAEGYRLLAALPAGGGHAVAVAGFRTGHSLADGYYLYVDDLSTAPEARRQGLAGRLLDWLEKEATRLGCDSLHLDSAVLRDRTDAHRLYFNHRLAITAFHFEKPL
jgi:GNAT superfamily N-acetyltransferase